MRPEWVNKWPNSVTDMCDDDDDEGSGCFLFVNHTKRLKYTTVLFEIGIACGTDGRREMCLQGFGEET